MFFWFTQVFGFYGFGVLGFRCRAYGLGLFRLACRLQCGSFLGLEIGVSSMLHKQGILASSADRQGQNKLNIWLNFGLGAGKTQRRRIFLANDVTDDPLLPRILHVTRKV